MDNFRSLSNKIPATLPRLFFGDIIYVFDPVFLFSFLFSRLNSQRAKKKYSSKGINSLWSALSLFLFGNISLIYFSCDDIIQLSHDGASRFRKTAAGRIIFSSN